MRTLKLILHFTAIHFVAVTLPVYSQLYSGPASGFVASGAIVSTNSTFSIPGFSQPISFKNKFVFRKQPGQFITGADKKIFDIQEDTPLSLSKETILDSAQAKVILNIPGARETNNTPPDPNIAVGPDFLVTVVNSEFSIFKKDGTLVKVISAGVWFASVAPGAFCFDPKVIYDHYSNRFVMVWLEQNNNTQTGNFLISVSDDDNPNGTWVNYALPANTEGSIPNGCWSDYQGVGYDDKALYLTANNYSFLTGFKYAKIRIIPKSGLYSNTAGRLDFSDLWDIRYPSRPSAEVQYIRPAIMYTPSNEYYLSAASPTSGNFVVLFKLSNVLTSPVLSGITLPTAEWNEAPDAGQQGGPAISTLGSVFTNEIKYSNGNLWIVHAIANPQNINNSALRVLKINPLNSSVLEDKVIGQTGYWYYFPALTADKDGNVAITFTRSGVNEFAGAFFTSRLSSQTQFSQSRMLRAGKAAYFKDFGTGVNRWGDYLSAVPDPANGYNIWLLSQFAAGPSSWGTQIGNILLTPYPGKNLTALTPLLSFHPSEINSGGDTVTAVVTNFGREAVFVDSIYSRDRSFRIAQVLEFPLSVGSYDTLSVRVCFSPNYSGVIQDTLRFDCSGINFPGIPLKGKGYKINPAGPNDLYAVSANSTLFKLNQRTGEASALGPLGFSQSLSLAVHPLQQRLYGLINTGTEIQLVVINATEGDAYTLFTVPLSDAASIAFDITGKMYLAQRSGAIYSVNLQARTIIKEDSVKSALQSIAFHFPSNQLFGTVYKPLGTGRDKIIKILLGTGDTVGVGYTGFNQITNSITFSSSGFIFGLKGAMSQQSDLIGAEGPGVGWQILGNSGITGLAAIAYSNTQVVSAEDNANLPAGFQLNQNYPNPFNPETVVTFAVAQTTPVTLRVYNMTGELVATLVNGTLEAGRHSVTFKANNLPSGIYLARLQSGSSVATRKMILQK